MRRSTRQLQACSPSETPVTAYVYREVIKKSPGELLSSARAGQYRRRPLLSATPPNASSEFFLNFI
jgi:hypothetical protein